MKTFDLTALVNAPANAAVSTPVSATASATTPAHPLDRPTAEEYASWFKALADATRIQIVSLLARRGTPMTVGEIVTAVDVGQSTVSAHLKVLSEIRFVLAERQGTASYYRINQACVTCFPTVADVLMGRPVPDAPTATACGLPTAADSHPKETPMTGQPDDLREHVRDRYAAAALQVLNGAQSTCCGGDSAADRSELLDDPRFGSDLYDPDARSELPAEAVAASLGCGNPTVVAELKAGETVLDLGSGGGIDVLLSARRVGPTGKAYGLDMTDEMLQLARANAAKAGATNVEFVKGTIESIPLPAETVDVVISNCVINLSVDKAAVFAETFRVLKPGGRIGVSDVVAEDRLTAAERAERGDHAGCIAGALSIGEYVNGLTEAGFTDIAITPTHPVADGMHSAIVRATKPSVGAAG